MWIRCLEVKNSRWKAGEVNTRCRNTYTLYRWHWLLVGSNNKSRHLIYARWTTNEVLTCLYFSKLITYGIWTWRISNHKPHYSKLREAWVRRDTTMTHCHLLIPQNLKIIVIESDHYPQSRLWNVSDKPWCIRSSDNTGTTTKSISRPVPKCHMLILNCFLRNLIWL